MAQTLPDIEVTSVWISLNSATGIAVGDSMALDNKAVPSIVVAEGTQPAVDSVDGVPLTTFRDTKSSKIIPAGSLEIWVRLKSTDVTAKGLISVQAL